MTPEAFREEYGIPLRSLRFDAHSVYFDMGRIVATYWMHGLKTLQVYGKSCMIQIPCDSSDTYLRANYSGMSACQAGLLRFDDTAFIPPAEAWALIAASRNEGTTLESAMTPEVRVTMKALVEEAKAAKARCIQRMREEGVEIIRPVEAEDE